MKWILLLLWSLREEHLDELGSDVECSPHCLIPRGSGSVACRPVSRLPADVYLTCSACNLSPSFLSLSVFFTCADE